MHHKLSYFVTYPYLLLRSQIICANSKSLGNMFIDPSRNSFIDASMVRDMCLCGATAPNTIGHLMPEATRSGTNRLRQCIRIDQDQVSCDLILDHSAYGTVSQMNVEWSNILKRLRLEMFSAERDSSRSDPMRNECIVQPCALFLFDKVICSCLLQVHMVPGCVHAPLLRLCLLINITCTTLTL
eukprot:812321-Amphidinium_carterae.1